MPRILRQRAYDGLPKAEWEYHIPWAHHHHGDFVRTKTLDEEVPTNNRKEGEPSNTFRQDVNAALTNQYNDAAYNVRDAAQKVLVARHGRPQKTHVMPSRNKYCGHFCLPHDADQHGAVDSYHRLGYNSWSSQAQYGCCRCRLAEQHFLVPTLSYPDLLRLVGISSDTVGHDSWGIPNDIGRVGRKLSHIDVNYQTTGRQTLKAPWNEMRNLHGMMARSLFFSEFTRLADQYQTEDRSKGLQPHQWNSSLNLWTGRIPFLLTYRGALQKDNGNYPVLNQAEYLKGAEYPGSTHIPLIGKLPPFALATHLGWHAGLRRPVTYKRGRRSYSKAEPKRIIDLLGIISGSPASHKMCVHCRHVVKALPMHLFWEARGYDRKSAMVMAEKDELDLKDAKAKYTPADLKCLAPMLGATQRDHLPAGLEDA